jgi:hypothetical protein
MDVPIPSEIQFETFGIPESSTWAMMLLGFAGLAFAGYRSAKAGHAKLAAAALPESEALRRRAATRSQHCFDTFE